MAIYIAKPWYKKGGNPDDYFDPVTHIATESNFIKFLDCGVYDSKYIGYGVDLGTTGIWIIEDVNHDSENTGQTNCYDLISKDCFSPATTWSSNGRVYYRNSNVRNNLINSVLPNLNGPIYSRLMKIKYYSWDTWYDDDYIVAPSEHKEIAQYATTGFPSEGSGYINMVNNEHRIKKYNNKKVYWWTRSCNAVPSWSGTNSAFYCSDSGSLTSAATSNYNYKYYLVGIIRVQ